MTEVIPAGDGTVEFQAVNMDNRVYLEDDLGPYQVILTSRPYAQEHQDAASGVFNTTAELVKMYSDYNHPPSDAAGIDSLIFTANMKKIVIDSTAAPDAATSTYNTEVTLVSK